MENKNNGGLVSNIGYFAIGAGIGAVLGVLYAPKAGSEARDDISSWLREKRSLGRHEYRAMREALEKGRRTVMHRVNRATGH